MKRHFSIQSLLLPLLLCFATIAVGQRVRISGATTAQVGEPIRIQYTIDDSDVNLTSPPSIQGGGVECVAGPNVSKRSSMSISIGGGGAQRQSNSSTTISFTYVADKATTITLSPATFEVGGKTVRSASHTIKFSGSAGNASTTPAQGTASATSGKANGGKGIIIRTIANKRNVYEQEPILLSYRVLSPVDLASLSGGLPSVKEFLRQDIPLPQDKQMTAETVNGKTYRSVLWSQHVLFPQQTGKLTIPSFELKGVTQELDRSVDPLDAFFNGGNALVTTPFTRHTDALTIEVKPLPANKPADFSGGVGQFTMQVQPPTGTPRTNEAYRLRITINGLGNHKLITPPTVAFPKSFQTYDTKTAVQTELTPDGLRGTITFDYTAVPKSTGKFDIPEITFVYFDTQQEQFRTLRSKGFSIQVEKGSDTAPVIDGARPDDIASLNLDEGRTITPSDTTIDGLTFIGLMLGVILLFALIFFLLRKEIALRSNKVLRRQRYAFAHAKQALQHLPTADTATFYGTLAQILHTYITHRFALATPLQSSEQAQALLAKHGADEALITRYRDLITRSQQATYAGQATSASLEAERTEALHIVQQIEQTQHD